MEYVVHPDKISRYLLNIASDVGGPKARFFMSCGFSPARPAEFEAALLDHPVQATLKSAEPHAEGLVLRYECLLQTPDRSGVCIRSIWIETHDHSRTRLITAYPYT